MFIKSFGFFLFKDFRDEILLYISINIEFKRYFLSVLKSEELKRKQIYSDVQNFTNRQMTK